MRKGIEELADELLSQINTTAELKQVSVALESLTQSSAFKSRAREVASNMNLTNAIKKSQLLFLFKDIDVPVLYTFFSDMFSDNEFWMFSSKQFDYFDEFVQTFQMLTEKVVVVNLVTAIEIKAPDLKLIAQNLTKSLGSHVIIHLQVNPGIIGGLQARVGNLVFDYTLRSKFHQFQRQWIAQVAKTTEMVGRG
ncbi:MAG: F0F1 ATP synthase subunit delta [Patescibacteria group bacterium]